MSSFRLSDDVKVILSYWLVWHKAPDATTVRIYAHNIWHWYHRNAQLPNSQTKVKIAFLIFYLLLSTQNPFSEFDCKIMKKILYLQEGATNPIQNETCCKKMTLLSVWLLILFFSQEDTAIVRN